MSKSAGDVTSETDKIRTLFKHIAALHDGIIETEQLDLFHDICPDPYSWRHLISAIPLDKLTFRLEIGIQRAEAISLLLRWCQKSTGSMPKTSDDSAAEIHGFLSVMLITLITMEEGAPPSSVSRGDTLDGNFGEVTGPRALYQHNCEQTCQALMKIPSVRFAILALYAPEDLGSVILPPMISKQRKKAIDEWGRLQADTLRFHRHGSTSFILRGSPEWSAGGRIKFALKCVLLPFSDIPVIASKTESYAIDYDSSDGLDGSVQHMVQVWASTTRWILMDFVEGLTLSEETEHLKRNLPRYYRGGRAQKTIQLVGNVRLDLIRILGLPLLGALGELHRAGKQHEDLSPSNIIIQRRKSRGGRYECDVTFIDFGRNYLYTRIVGGYEGSDATFVAPEVRSNENDVGSADIYSMGQILIALGDVGLNRDGTIPDRFYGQAPLIARLIEDLIDERSERRLLIFGAIIEGGDIYGYLQEVLEQELDVAQAELEPDSGLREYAVPHEKEWLSSSLKSLFSLSSESRKRRRIYRVRREQGVLSDPRRSMHARWLLAFSIFAAFNYFITAFVCISWFWRDIGIDILSPPIQVVLRLVGVDSSGVPLIDDLRQYQLGQVVNNLPARIVGLSFALAGARYYQNILSGLTTKVAQSPALGGTTGRVVTEIAMRTMAIWSSWLILASNLVQVQWWPLATAIGYTGVLLANVLSARFATKYLTMARNCGLSTVPAPHQKVTGLDGYRQWAPSMFFYTITVWVFAIFIYYGILKDVYVYAILVALVNVVLFYIIKTGVNALDIRTGLNKCFLAAERLRYEKEQDISKNDLKRSVH